MITQIRKKAQEVSFVLLRIAGYIRHKELAARLESISYRIIESLYSDDLNTAMSNIEAAIGLSSLASNIGEVNANNTAIILKELENLKNGINQFKASREVREMPSVEGLFSKLTIAAPAKPIRSEQRPSQKPEIVVNKTQGRVSLVQEQTSETNGSAIIRQNSILAIIKKSHGGKLQLKDIIAAFPDISERTLRYDLVKLCQIGKLQRQGAGGPSNFYVAPDSIAALSQAERPIPSDPNSHNGGVMNNSPSSL